MSVQCDAPVLRLLLSTKPQRQDREGVSLRGGSYSRESELNFSLLHKHSTGVPSSSSLSGTLNLSRLVVDLSTELPNGKSGRKPERLKSPPMGGSEIHQLINALFNLTPGTSSLRLTIRPRKLSGVAADLKNYKNVLWLENGGGEEEGKHAERRKWPIQYRRRARSKTQPAIMFSEQKV
jgi:hypothetical protein